MRRLVIPLLGLSLSLAAAQAPATPRPVDPDLIFTLLGSANTIAIDVPEDVRHLYLVAVLDGQVVLENDRALTARPGGELTATITAGAIGPTNAAPVRLFFHTGLEGADGRRFAGGTTVRRFEQAHDSPVRRIRVPSPLLNSSGTHDVPLETWLAVEAVFLEAWIHALDPGSLEGAVVFYLYLGTEDGASPPATPAFTTWEEIRRAFSTPTLE